MIGSKEGQGRAHRSLMVGLTALAARPTMAAQLDAVALTDFLCSGMALAVVPVLAYVGLRVLRQARRRGWVARSPMTVCATLPLGMREKIVLVDVDGRMLVLGVTAQRITLLRDSPAFDLHPDAVQDVPK